MIITEINLTPESDLYSELRGLCKYADSDIKTDETIEIILSNGNYAISNALEFRYNVIIQGNIGTRVYATNFNGWTDDALISVKGTILLAMF